MLISKFQILRKNETEQFKYRITHPKSVIWITHALSWNRQIEPWS